MNQEWSDEQLFKSFATDGNKEAFDELVRRHHKHIIDFIFRMVRDLSRAEDLAQTTFIMIFQKAGSYMPNRPFKPWLFTIAKNCVLSELRKKHYEYETFLDDRKTDALIENNVSTPDTSAERSEIRGIVRTVVDSLPPKKKMMLIMRFFEDMKYSEIAETMGCSEGTVKSNVFYGLQILSEKLQKMGIQP